MRLRVAFMAALLAADAQGVVGEAVREFRDWRWHAGKDAAASCGGPSSARPCQTLDESGKSLRPTTKILIGAILVSGALVAYGSWRVDEASERLRSATAACEQTNERSKAARTPAGYLEMDCNGFSLAYEAKLVGVQGEIQEAWHDLNFSNDLYPMLGLAVAVIGAIPWLWYFLLRRVAELRKAASGDAPER